MSLLIVYSASIFIILLLFWDHLFPQLLLYFNSNINKQVPSYSRAESHSQPSSF